SQSFRVLLILSRCTSVTSIDIMSTTHFEIGAAMVARTERVDRTRDSVRAAADACFREFGFDAATGSEIARRAGVAEGTVFLHFGSKLGLLQAVTVAYYDRIQAEAEAVAAREPNAEQRFRALVDTWAASMERDWDLIAVFVHRAERIPGELSDTVTAM